MDEMKFNGEIWIRIPTKRAEIEAVIERNREGHARKPVREILAVRVSRDYGKTWPLAAICTDCCASIEPPVQRRKEGAAGVRYCDWCGARNSMYEGKK